MWGLEILAEKNSSAAKQAAFPARCKMAGKVAARGEVRGTSTFIEPARSYNRKIAYYRTIGFTDRFYRAAQVGEGFPDGNQLTVRYGIVRGMAREVLWRQLFCRGPGCG